MDDHAKEYIAELLEANRIDRAASLLRLTMNELTTWLTPGTNNYREFGKRPHLALETLMPQFDEIAADLPAPSGKWATGDECAMPLRYRAFFDAAVEYCRRLDTLTHEYREAWIRSQRDELYAAYKALKGGPE